MTVPMCGNTQQDVCVNPNDFQLEVRVTMETQTFEFYCTGQNEHGSATTTTVNVTRAQGTYVRTYVDDMYCTHTSVYRYSTANDT